MDLAGPGLGLRRDLVSHLKSHHSAPPHFLEFAPENWIGIGGHWKKVLTELSERFPFTTHGLSLSLGSPEPLDWDFLTRLKQFFSDIPVEVYSEHLSYSKCDNAHLHDLLPVPFREDAVAHVANRIAEVQDFLGRQIAIENVSYYTPVAPEMDEATFISEIVTRSDCKLLLDVNNVYVNAFNHGYNAKDFIKKLPLNKVAYVHIAGHEQVSEDLIIDTHGQAIIDPVFELFDWAAKLIPPVPVLLERDFNFPEFSELLEELDRLEEITHRAWKVEHAA